MFLLLLQSCIYLIRPIGATEGYYEQDENSCGILKIKIDFHSFTSCWNLIIQFLVSIVLLLIILSFICYFLRIRRSIKNSITTVKISLLKTLVKVLLFLIVMLLCDISYWILKTLLDFKIISYNKYYSGFSLMGFLLTGVFTLLIYLTNITVTNELHKMIEGEHRVILEKVDISNLFFVEDKATSEMRFSSKY